MINKLNLKSLSRDELVLFFKETGLPRYRADQLLHWVYERFAEDIRDITEFSVDLRRRLGGIASINGLRTLKRLFSEDKTEKYLFELEDGETIESVLIPDKDRLTLCISSQVGCAMGCRFCVTGGLGLIRNLKAYEIVDQVISVNRTIGPDRRISNIVLMGMGEPLANFDNVSEALWRLTSLLGISKRRITLSTAGLVPGMRLLADKAHGVNLAISLNASNDKARNEIMPINKKFPIRVLLEACRRFPLPPGRRITFEYVLIDNVNDSSEDAGRLAGLVKGLQCKINLIPLNPHSGTGLRRPSDEAVLSFQKVLSRNHITALIRESRGADISAACGQLKASH
ncbi:MAG: 23S rRNA (adenine(2503)-C(2))-methyltransferase RlmN [Nitrospirae bacterium]|nr:23S rRNA (adenine(2503)-C(2))-methyltransferase RlmN [Nitrospirota bacterium]